MPVLTALVSHETAAVYNAILLCLIHASHGKIPAFIMTDGAVSERSAIAATINPAGDISPDRTCRHIICYFHVGRALLRSIYKVSSADYPGNPVMPAQKRRLYATAMFIVRMPNARRCKRAITALKNLCGAHPALELWYNKTFSPQYVGDFMERVAEWCLAMRNSTWPTTNNMIECKCACVRGWLHEQQRQLLQPTILMPHQFRSIFDSVARVPQEGVSRKGIRADRAPPGRH